MRWALWQFSDFFRCCFDFIFQFRLCWISHNKITAAHEHPSIISSSVYVHMHVFFGFTRAHTHTQTWFYQNIRFFATKRTHSICIQVPISTTKDAYELFIFFGRYFDVCVCSALRHRGTEASCSNLDNMFCWQKQWIRNTFVDGRRRSKLLSVHRLGAYEYKYNTALSVPDNWAKNRCIMLEWWWRGWPVPVNSENIQTIT